MKIKVIGQELRRGRRMGGEADYEKLKSMSKLQRKCHIKGQERRFS